MKRFDLLYLVGALAITLGLMASPSPGWAAYGDYLSSITSGSLNQPAKVAVDQSNGDVYVTDAGNKMVKKYDKGGNYISTFSLALTGAPVGIAVDSTNIFVGDSTNKCVWIYNKSGAYADLSGTGTSHKLGGASGVGVTMPNSVAVAPSGHIFVCDGDNDKVYIYNANGTMNSSFGGSGPGANVSGDTSPTVIYMNYPSGVAMGSSSTASGIVTQNFFLVDQGNYRVLKLHYAYSSYTNAITTAPTFDGYEAYSGSGKGDAFGYFLRPAGVAWDSAFKQLVAVDSLQQVGQLFDSNGNTLSQALNYSGTSVQGYLNIPTGVAVDNMYHKAYIASNQGNSVGVFDLVNGIPPTITYVSPHTADVTPTSAPYFINYSGADSDGASSSETVRLYYYAAGTPDTKVLLASQTVATDTSGNFYGDYGWDFTSLPVGTYNAYIEVTDATGNTVNATSAHSLIVAAGAYPSCPNYTNAMYAEYGDPSADPDADGLSNCEEVFAQHPDTNNHYTSNPLKASTDGTGMTDLQKRDAHTLWPAVVSCAFLNPNTPSTYGGCLSDWDNINRSIDPCNSTAGCNVSSNPIGAVINFGSFSYSSYAEMMNTSDTVSVTGDLEMKRTDGTIAAEVKGIYLAPHASTSIHIQDYTDENNLSLDFVSVNSDGTTTKYIVGTVDCYPLDSQLTLKDDYLMNMDAVGATTMETGAFNDNFASYYACIAIRNPSQTDTVDATIHFYDTSGNVAGTDTYTLQPLGAVIINPTGAFLPQGVVSGGLTTGGQYNASIQGYVHNTSTPDNVVADVAIFNIDSSGTESMAIALPTETQLANTLVWDTFNDGFASYVGWAGLKNPNSTAATVNVYYYSQSGSLATCTATTSNPTGANPVTKTIQPHQTIAWRPTADGLAGGQYNMTMQAQGGAQISGYGQFFHRTGSVNDFMIGFIFSRNTMTTAYVPYWRDEPSNPGSRVTYYCVRNPGASPINFTAYYYNSDGSLITSVLHTNLAPNAATAIRPWSDCGGQTTTPTQGSIKIVATDPGTGNPIPCTGWVLRLKNKDNSSAAVGAGEGILESAPPQ